MHGAGVAAATVDFLEDHRGLGQAQARTAILGGNQRRQPACLGQRVDEGFREALVLIDLAPVGGVEFATEGAHAFANGIQLFIGVGVHLSALKAM
ncbi:hypothetical protein D3C71_1936050 [compost metagenome]